MTGRRKYERYDVSCNGDKQTQIKASVKGEHVQLVNYSLGGVFFLSKKSFPVGETIKISIDLENRGEIHLLGKVVRVNSDGDIWGTAIDFLTLKGVVG
jgi:Tfp pilus assembly protein PilZ